MTLKDRKDFPPIAGVIGWPIGHSRSPLMHNHWLAEAGIEGRYVALGIPPEDLEGELKVLIKKGFRGLNVTIPHKSAVRAAMDRLDEAARIIGAVNTIIIEPDGSLEGRNTDAAGFIENLAQARTEWRARSALVLGAGGAARAVVYGLARAGVEEIVIANRTRARAEAIAADLAGLGARVLVAEWETIRERMKGASLLVNTTSLGMTGAPPLTLDLTPLPADALVTDIVYAPLETELLAAARARGLETVDGLGMLIHQARFAFEAWFGTRPAASAELRDALVEDLKRTEKTKG